MKPRLSPDTRWQLYKRLSSRPALVSFLRARRYDRREYLREWLGTRNERELLRVMRGGRDVCWVEGDEESEPLVTVVIPTFQRPDTILRAVRSAQTQTYERLEILVIGDGTDGRTQQLLTTIPDRRVRFVNLPYQGVYPSEVRLRGRIAGVKPMNVGIDLAAGAWLTGVDDDDELLPHHVEALLRDAKSRRLEMIYSRYELVEPQISGELVTTIRGGEPIRFGVVARGTVLYSMGLRFMKYEPECWRIRDPADWNLWKRMQLAGVRIGFNPSVTYRVHARGAAKPST